MEKQVSSWKNRFSSTEKQVFKLGDHLIMKTLFPQRLNDVYMIQVFLKIQFKYVYYLFISLSFFFLNRVTNRICY